MGKKILFIGDVVGKPGRDILKKHLKSFVRQNEVDFVIANGENAAAGAGITKGLSCEIRDCGVDAITLGDHIWDQKGFQNEIDELEFVCRPANLPGCCPGQDHLIVEKNGFRLGIITVLGQVFMKIHAASPMETLDTMLANIQTECDAIVVEVHAEATSEKIALGYHLDGKVSLVVGTHTHIPTADAQILPMGTAYLTDAGMTGPYLSVLGREVGPVLERMRDGMPRRFPVATDNVMLCGCLLTLNDTHKPRSIEPVKIQFHR